MSPFESTMTPLPRSSVPGAPRRWATMTTSPARTAWYAAAAAGGWDCNCETAVLAFWLAMALTSLVLRSGRPEMRRLVT